jgi:deoxyribose-phosphate aldolase
VQDTAIASTIDHTLLKPDATADAIAELCREAVHWRFATVCINPCWVPFAVDRLAGDEIAVATVCGFPLGASATAVKAAEARLAFQQGAREVDMVLSLGAARMGDWGAVEADIAAVVAEAPEERCLVKVILECALFDAGAIEEAARRAVAGGAAFVKTSTGFLGGGATVEDVELLKRTVAPTARVKASGGIRTLEQARAMIAAGADRLGTSSGVAIMSEAVAQRGS